MNWDEINQWIEKIGLPQIQVTSLRQHPYQPDQETMDRFKSDPKTVWDACRLWLDYLQNPPADPPEYDFDFDNLTDALQLWASLNGLGDGMPLIDGAILWYQPKARELGLDARLRAEAFVQLIQNRAELTEEQRFREAPKPEPSSDSAPYLLRREGQGWKLCFESEVSGFPDKPDFEWLKKLLSNPGQQIHAVTLMGMTPCRAARTDPAAIPQGLHGHLSRQEKTDLESLRAVAKRREEVQRDLEKAKKDGDPLLINELETENEKLQAYLEENTGIGGKLREFAEGDMARKTADVVRKRFQRLWKYLQEHGMPKAAQHFTRSIKLSGFTFTYLPEEPAPDWKL
jgi:hypothetical protein